ncbi:MAG: AMP phosphorylase [Candidatus Woesearchaeota archaeon]|nr:MAG: AMP phosphorylase [Candidatus Woesearchaeota archaeon]
MKLKAVIRDIYSGGPLIISLSTATAHKLDLFPGDRVKVSAHGKYVIAVSDISEELRKDEIGILAEVNKCLNLNDGELVSIEPTETPQSLTYIRKKLDNKKLTKDEIFSIVDDIVDNVLTEAEVAYLISAAYINEFSMEETESLVRAMALSGEILRWKDKRILDIHCIGGVPGNRTTPIVVPIIAAAGVIIPKTSSRAITSPSGTADTMEVLTNVEIKDSEQVKRVVNRISACLLWGGALNIAPADDKIIRIEKPLSLDPTAMLLSSIMAKKYAVGSTHVLIDIPLGYYAKVESEARYKELKTKFEDLGRRLHMTVKVIKTDAKGPIGKGIGPALEARDVMWILEADERGPEDLKDKSLMLAGTLLEMAQVAEKGKGIKTAKEILHSGKALRKMKQIIEAQGGDSSITSKDIEVGEFSYDFRAEKSGKVTYFRNHGLSISRLAGAPKDKKAGIYLHKKLGEHVEEGEILFTVYSESKRKLDEAVEYAIDNFPIIIK